MTGRTGAARGGEGGTGPCGHDLGAYDIVAFGGPGGVVECTVCGHRVVSPPSDAVDKGDGDGG